MNTSHIPDAVPRHEPRSKYGNPASYEVHGKRYYVMASATNFSERGIASWYGRKFHGRRTSSGETYDMYAMTAAHKTLPIPTYVRVSNLKNGLSTVVRVNDRGPFHDNRIIDLSYAAASKLGIVENGTGLVEIKVLTPGQREPTPTRIAEQAPPTPLPQSVAPGAEVTVTSPVTSPATPDTKKADAALGVQMYLQLGAFLSRTNAEQLCTKLEAHKLDKGFIAEGPGNTGTIYRVRIGPLASVEEADNLANQVSALGMGMPSVVID